MLVFTNVPGRQRPTEHVLPMSCITCLGAFVNTCHFHDLYVFLEKGHAEYELIGMFGTFCT